MPIHKQLAQLGPAGSDHAIQGIEVTEGNLIVRGLTHNMLNKCHSAKRCPVAGQSFSNNPFNVCESERSYIVRKQRQLNHYLKLIKTQVKDKASLDFIFLQEPDIFYRELSKKWPEQQRNLMIERFNQALMKLDWDFHITEKSDHCRPLVTLTNNKTLSIEATRAIFPSGLKNSGFELACTHQSRQKPLYLTNVHFNFELPSCDLSKAITDYLFDNTLHGYLTVLGGDCNHVRNSLIAGQGPCKQATTLVTDKFGRTVNRTHEGLLADYDSFFVAPGSKTGIANAKPICCHAFGDQDFEAKRLEDSKDSAHSPVLGWPVMRRHDFVKMNKSLPNEQLRSSPAPIMFTPQLPSGSHQIHQLQPLAPTKRKRF